LVASASFEEALTVVRTRGMISVKPNVYTADASIMAAIGVGIVSAEALAAGVASIPEPFTDADWGGWYVWQSFAYVFEFNAAATLAFPASAQFEIDSKAMRKVSPNEALVVIAESLGGAFEISTPLRTLVKLS